MPSASSVRAIHAPPAFHLLDHFGMVEIHVVEDQEVVVPFSPSTLRSTSFALDEVDGPFAGLVYLIGSGEVVPVPFEGGVLVAAPRKGVSGPAFDFDGGADHLLAVFGIDFAGHGFFRCSRRRFLVHHRVDIDRNPLACSARDRLLQLLPRAVLAWCGRCLSGRTRPDRRGRRRRIPRPAVRRPCRPGGIRTEVTPTSCRCRASSFNCVHNLPSLGRFHSKYCIITPFS